MLQLLLVITTNAIITTGANASAISTTNFTVDKQLLTYLL